jgi:hypothetical protein
MSKNGVYWKKLLPIYGHLNREIQQDFNIREFGVPDRHVMSMCG